MKLFKLMKDGGKESRVWGFFLAEVKSLFSVVLLHFADGSREAFHSHAFNSISWVLKGELKEARITYADGLGDVELDHTYFTPSFRPVITTRENLHKVVSTGDTYVLSFRGPWVDFWYELVNGDIIKLTHGRKIVDRGVQVWHGVTGR